MRWNGEASLLNYLIPELSVFVIEFRQHSKRENVGGGGGGVGEVGGGSVGERGGSGGGGDGM